MIAALYGRLAALTPTPVVQLNRAVAVSMAEGPAAALELDDAPRHEPALKEYHLLPSVRGDLLERLGRTREAAAESGRAASLTRNARERELLSARARTHEPGTERAGRVNGPGAERATRMDGPGADRPARTDEPDPDRPAGQRRR